MNIDLNQLASALIAGGAIWAGIRMEIKFLWKSVDEIKQELKELKGGN